MPSVWLRSKLITAVVVVAFVSSIAVIGLVLDGPAQARGGGGFGGRGGGFGGGGLGRGGDFGGMSQARTNLYAPRYDGGSPPAGWGQGPGDRGDININRNYNGGWGYGWGGDGFAAGLAVGGALDDTLDADQCQPYYYAGEVYCF